MLSVLLADDNRPWVEALRIAIDRNVDFEVIAIAYDGREALEKIINLKPDIVILDIIMPEFDGAYIVNYIRKHMDNYMPIVYILSGIGTDTVIKILNDLDIDFYSMKPITVETVMDSLHKIISRQNDGNPVFNEAPLREPLEIIKDVLLKLGMPPNKLSTFCILDALQYYYENPDCIRLLTKVLYPKIARERELSPASVEKNIRDAIAKMQKKSTSLYLKIFAYAEGQRVTNGEFLSVVIDYIKRN